MITQEQIEAACCGRYSTIVPAVLTRDFIPRGLNYELPKGTIVEIELSPRWSSSILVVANKGVDYRFPYDAAELLE